MNVAFDLFEDRPESVLAAIQRATRNTASTPKPSNIQSGLAEKPSASIAKATPSKSLMEPTSAAIKSEVEILPVPSVEEEAESTNVAVIHPEGPSVEQLFREGQIHLQSGNKAARIKHSSERISPARNSTADAISNCRSICENSAHVASRSNW